MRLLLLFSPVRNIFHDNNSASLSTIQLTNKSKLNVQPNPNSNLIFVDNLPTTAVDPSTFRFTPERAVGPPTRKTTYSANTSFSVQSIHGRAPPTTMQTLTSRKSKSWKATRWWHSNIYIYHCGNSVKYKKRKIKKQLIATGSFTFRRKGYFLTILSAGTTSFLACCTQSLKVK